MACLAGFNPLVDNSFLFHVSGKCTVSSTTKDNISKSVISNKAKKEGEKYIDPT